jgi:membrane protease YdiL (CAAX protease family)
MLEDTSSLAAYKISWAMSLPWKLLPGFHFCLLGLLLIAIYTSRVAFGIAALPLSLPVTAASAAVDSTSWQRIQLLIWVLVGPLFLLSRLFSLITVGIPMILTSHLPTYTQSNWFARCSPIVEALLFLGVIALIVRREGREVVWKSMRIPETRYVSLALAIPIGIAVFLSTGQYLFDRAGWAAHNFGNMMPPRIGSYFTLPDLWLLLLFFSALSEEMIFRGLLQRGFIQRYGIYRGIFLVGIVWAASHFFSDFAFSRVTDQEAILKLASRILTCLALSYVLGWLTLRTGSILPATLAHTFLNVRVFSGFGQPFPGKNTIQVALWGVLAYVLFRYWPVRDENGPEAAMAVANPEPAV